jgi:hypothetical protein
MSSSRKNHRKHRSESESDNSDYTECRRRKSPSPERCRRKSPSPERCRRKSPSPERRHHKQNKELDCFTNRKRSASCSSSSSSSSDCEKKFKFEDVCNYFKYRLLKDEELMVGGSDAYFNSVNDTTLIIPTYSSAKLNKNLLSRNIETVSVGSPFYVRESGVYILFFITQTDNACQFTVFVNGVLEPLTCVGTNSSAGQVVSRHMLKLKKDDNIVIRNYISGSSSVSTNNYAGGSQPGNDMTLLLMKIAPYNTPCVNHEELKCLSKNKRCLFRKITEKLLCDHTLMMRGFNVMGTFFNKMTQVVNTEGDVGFNESSNVHGLDWSPLNPTQLKVVVPGVYKLFFLVNTNTPAQFALTVNGNPVETSTQGSNRGAGQITLRTLLELNTGDVVTVRNHTSANGNIVISQEAGGAENTLSTILTVFRIAPLPVLWQPQIDPKLAECYKCVYDKFKNYLLSKHKLQIAGSPSYLSLTSSVPQTVNVNDSFNMYNNVLEHNIHHQPGSSEIVIRQDGIYDIFTDIITDEALQMTLFINNVADANTVFGRDSGGSRTLMRQFVRLKCGDVITVRNHTSHAGTVRTAENPGGNFIGQNSLLMAFLLANPPHC